MVCVEEIEKNDFNLNLPRYIDSQEPEDLQDIEGHLKRRHSNRDIEAMEKYGPSAPTSEPLFKDPPQLFSTSHIPLLN